MIILPMVELTSETQLVEQRTEQAVCQGRVFPCTQEESAAQRNGQTPKQPHVRSPVLVSEVRFILSLGAFRTCALLRSDCGSLFFKRSKGVPDEEKNISIVSGLLAGRTRAGSAGHDGLQGAGEHYDHVVAYDDGVRAADRGVLCKSRMQGRGYAHGDEVQLLHPRGIQGMDRPFEEGATEHQSSRQWSGLWRGRDDQGALEDEIVRAIPHDYAHYRGRE